MKGADYRKDEVVGAGLRRVLRRPRAPGRAARGVLDHEADSADEGGLTADMRTIALFLPNWVGDVVMATPAIRAVREHFPAARLVAVCRPYVARRARRGAVVRRRDPVRQDGAAGAADVGVARRLRRERRRRGASCSRTRSASACVAALGGCRRRIGFARYGRGLLLTDALQPAATPPAARAVAGHRRLQPARDAPLGVPDPGHRMELFTTPADEAAADRVWARPGPRPLSAR